MVTIDPIIKLNETRSNIESRSISEIDVLFPPFLGRRLLIILNFFLSVSFFAFLFSEIIIFLQKRKNWKTHIFINTVVSQKVPELQRSTIPHLKALDQLF